MQLEGILLWDNPQMETEEKDSPYSLFFRSMTSIRPQGENKTPPLTALDILITLEGREGRKLWDSNKPDP